MIDRLTSSGIIIYDPNRGEMKSRTKWWAVVNVDREITRYYRWWVNQQYWGRKILDKPWLHAPAWDAHISIVRGEEPRDELKHLWKKHHKKRVTFEYEPYPMRSDPARYRHGEGDFWYIHVYCPLLMDIRAELGLKTHHRSHLTFGRSYV